MTGLVRLEGHRDTAVAPHSTVIESVRKNLHRRDRAHGIPQLSFPHSLGQAEIVCTHHGQRTAEKGQPLTVVWIH